MGIFNRHSVTVTDAAERTATGAVLLDVRTKQEQRAGVAQGAWTMTPASIEKRSARLHGQKVYVICRSGNRSRQVAHFLRGQGVDATNVRGGMMAWERAGLPMSKTHKGAKQ